MVAVCYAAGKALGGMKNLKAVELDPDLIRGVRPGAIDVDDFASRCSHSWTHRRVCSESDCRSPSEEL